MNARGVLRRFGPLALVPLLAACGSIPGTSSPSRVARGLVDRASEKAGWTMERSPRDAPALALVQRVVGPESNTEALEFDGTGFDGHVVLRFTTTVEGDEFEGDATVVGCYRYRMTQQQGVRRRHLDRCPSGPASEIPAAPPPPQLPVHADRTLARVLDDVGREPAPQLDTVLPQVRRSFFQDGVVSDAVVDGEVVGIAVGVPDSCFFGRRLGATDAYRVEVWHVPHVLAQPGELGCSARAAAAGSGKQPPH